jgi:hypothetical protein
MTPVVVVSSLFYFKEELAAEFLSTLVPQLNDAREKLGAELRLVVTLNFPFSPALWADLLQDARRRCVEGVHIEWVERGYNLGFGASHRHVFECRKSEVFVVMNNDLFCEGTGWLSEMAGLILGKEGADIVGARENLTRLRDSDACGVGSESRPEEADFCDGSLLALRSAAVRQLGLFSRDFRMFYFEDSDLWLRFKQAGARMACISVPHRHLRSASSRQMPRHVLENLLDANRSAFFAKWEGYLGTRRMMGRICADLRSLGEQELIDVIPALVGFSFVDHPRASMDVLLAPGVETRLFSHVRSWRVRSTPGNEPVVAADHDRVWRAEPPDPKSMHSAVLQHLSSLSLQFPAEELRAYWAGAAYAEGEQPVAFSDAGPLALVVVQAADPRFAGLEPEPGFHVPVAGFLRKRGYRVLVMVSQGQDSSPEGCEQVVCPGPVQAAALFMKASLVVTAANAYASLAQQLGRRCFVVCGSRLADRVIWDWSRSMAWSREGLDCLGCHHLWGRRDRAFCLRTGEACISVDQGEACAKALAAFEEGGVPPLLRALQRSRELDLVRYRPSTDLDLSKWSDD